MPTCICAAKKANGDRKYSGLCKDQTGKDMCLEPMPRDATRLVLFSLKYMLWSDLSDTGHQWTTASTLPHSGPTSNLYQYRRWPSSTEQDGAFLRHTRFIHAYAAVGKAKEAGHPALLMVTDGDGTLSRSSSCSTAAVQGSVGGIAVDHRCTGTVTCEWPGNDVTTDDSYETERNNTVVSFKISDIKAGVWAPAARAR